MLMDRTFTWLDFFMESEADLQSCIDDMLNEEEQHVQSGPSTDSLSKILDFAAVYSVEVTSLGVAEFYKN